MKRGLGGEIKAVHLDAVHLRRFRSLEEVIEEAWSGVRRPFTHPPVREFTRREPD